MNPHQSIRDTLETSLAAAAERLQAADFPSDMVEGLKRLVQQVREPFVLAVVGMVKAGKSFLVNTLLGEDLAKVGATETTATVNWFRHGRSDPNRPVRCYRRGQAEPELHPRSFLDRLQGDDEETLRLGSDIERIEYWVDSKDSEWLRSVILVDTPGLGAVSDEHQDRTAEFIRLNSLLRERHHRETQRLAQEADAILYVLPPQFRASDRSFFEEFQGMVRHGTSCFNAIAVIGKYDEQDHGDFENGRRQAARLAQQMGILVNTVFPVSAGVHRLVQRYRGAEQDFTEFLRFAHQTDEDVFCLLTDDHNLFINFKGWALRPERRAELVGETPWASFRAAALYARKHRDRRPVELLDDLERLAGFSELRSTIDRTFVSRGAMLRCYRVVQNAEAILENGSYEHVESCRSTDAAAKALEKRFHSVLKKLAPAALPQDRATVDELAAFVTQHLVGVSNAEKVRAVHAEIRLKFADLRRSLESWCEDIACLQTLSDHLTLFSGAEVNELQSLFGKTGIEIASRVGDIPEPATFVRSRQSHWYERSRDEPQAVRRLLSSKAAARYESLLYAIREKEQVGSTP